MADFEKRPLSRAAMPASVHVRSTSVETVYTPQAAATRQQIYRPAPFPCNPQNYPTIAVCRLSQLRRGTARGRKTTAMLSRGVLNSNIHRVTYEQSSRLSNCCELLATRICKTFGRTKLFPGVSDIRCCQSVSSSTREIHILLIRLDQFCGSARTFCLEIIQRAKNN